MANIQRTTRVLISVACALSGIRMIGCAEAEEFRAVAGDSIQSGLQTIATGVIDGLFAVIEPDNAADDTSN